MPASLLLLMIVLMVWALVEVAQADRNRVRLLSKPVWIVLIVLLSPVAALAWFFFGRPAKDGMPVGARPPARPAPWAARAPQVDRPAPDDDPEFLASLKRQADRDRRAREMEQGRDAANEPDVDPDRRD